MNSPLDSLSETSFQFAQARSGAMTVSWNGRYLCSSRDPLAEASSWLRQQFFKEEPAVIILGLGAGHHVRALAEARPQQKLIVFDFHQQLIERFKQQESIKNCGLYCIPEQKESQIAEYIKMALPVLIFRSAWSGLEAKYENLRRDLSGQNIKSFSLQSEVRGHYQLSQALRAKFTELVSIKEIASVFENDKSQEAKMWQALRELVK